jgi:fucose 4-O-acetylase-like acetyltransferase
MSGLVQAAAADRIGDPTAPDRNRYADLLRVGAILAVVYGHWVLTAITDTRGRLSGLDALEYVSWGRWVTLPLQVMPVFFLVGGYANAVSWTSHQARGETWTTWVRGRAMRLLWPTSIYAAAATIAAGLAIAAGVPAAELAQAGWLIALHLWFLPVYLLLIALTPVMLTAQRRWGLATPTAMALAAAGVDAGVLGPHLPVIGFANYFLVWGSAHQWGFAWRDGSLTRYGWRPWLLAGAGLALLAGLLAWSPFPVDMIGAGERITNTGPPSIALLALAATETGLLLAAEPTVTRLLDRERWWRLVSCLNPKVMTIYLWHMAPVVVVAVALYPTGVMPQPPIGSAHWWALRVVWFAALTIVLVLVVWAVMWAERPLRLLPAGLCRTGPWSPLLLALGLAAAMTGLTKLAISGFAPGGSLPWPVLAALAGGMLLALMSGRVPRLALTGMGPAIRPLEGASKREAKRARAPTG